MWPGRAFLVGENGPEVFVPKSRGTILPTEFARRAAGSTTIVNMTIKANDPNAFRASSAQALADAKRRARMR